MGANPSGTQGFLGSQQYDANWVHSNTVTGGANSTTGASGTWGTCTDIEGGVWNITSNQLVGNGNVTGSPYLNDFLQMGSLSIQDQLIVATIPAGVATGNDGRNLCLRLINGQSAGANNCYYMHCGLNAGATTFTLQFFGVKAGALVNAWSQTATIAYNNTHTYLVCGYAIGVSPTYLGGTIYDTTAGTSATLALQTDTTQIPALQAAQGAGLSVEGGNTAIKWGEVWIFDQSKQGVALGLWLPNFAQSLKVSATGQTVYLVGGGTSWTPSTTFNLTTAHAASITATTIVDATHATLTMNASNAAETVTITDTSVTPNTTATLDMVALAAAVPINDPNITWSPWTWRRSGTTYMQSNNPGSYIELGFTSAGSGSLAISVDVTPETGASLGAGNYPSIKYSVGLSTGGNVNWGAWTTHQLLSTDTSITLASGLASGTYYARIDFFQTNEQNDNTPDRWTTPVLVVRVTGFTLAANQTTVVWPWTSSLRILGYGESDVEGLHSVGPYGSDQQDTSLGYAPLTMMGLGGVGANYGNVGFNGQGMTRSGAGNVPIFNAPSAPLSQSWDKFDGSAAAGSSRLTSQTILVPDPTDIIIWHGGNDGLNSVAAATVQQYTQNVMTMLRAAAQPHTRIHVAIQPGGWERTGLTNAVTAQADPYAEIVDLGTEMQNGLTNAGGASRRSRDTLHPDSEGGAEAAVRYVAAIQSFISRRPIQSGAFANG